MPRIMGLDVGDKRIGVSISDPSYVLASPRKVMTRISDESVIETISQMVESNDIVKIVIGMPYSLNGMIGKQAEKVLDFKQKLSDKLKIELVMQDERLTSVSANQKLREAGKKGNKIKQEVDSAAATIILQSYLDTMGLADESSA